MTTQVTLHIRACDPDSMATLESLLTAVEDARPPELCRPGELSREDLVALRDRTALALWNGQVAEGQLSLRWLHRESRWKTPADRSPDEFVRVHQGMALIDMFDLLIAGLRAHDRVKVNVSAGEADG
jgi:hypothetical protein